jgi:hypothetical protein
VIKSDYVPSIFIGSSSEALRLAEEIRSELEKRYKVTLWKSAFSLGSDTLSELLQNSQYHDFAVLVLTEDDKTISRKIGQASPRDNVIFELGLFMGAMGRHRAFEVIAKSSRSRLKIPSDLFGNTALYLPEDLHKTLDPKQIAESLKAISSAIDKQLTLSHLQLLPSTATAIGYYINFVKPVGEKLLADHRDGRFKLKIVLPKTLNDASKEGAKLFANRLQLEDHSVEIWHRPSHFFRSQQSEDNCTVYYDYPTTLHSSYEAIAIQLQQTGAIGETEQHAHLGEREIRNFHKTLLTKLAHSEAAMLRGKVSILQLEE